MIRTQNRNELPDLVTRVCKDLTGSATSREVSLLIGTAAVESHFEHRTQIGGGPARGICQMEPNTAIDIFQNYLQYRPHYFGRLVRIWLELEYLPFWTPTYEDIEHHLYYYDDFAFAMARLKYLGIRDAIPENVLDQAIYWKQFYNTARGKGTVKKYMEAWSECNCNQLLNCK